MSHCGLFPDSSLLKDFPRRGVTNGGPLGKFYISGLYPQTTPFPALHLPCIDSPLLKLPTCSSLGLRVHKSYRNPGGSMVLLHDTLWHQSGFYLGALGPKPKRTEVNSSRTSWRRAAFLLQPKRRRRTSSGVNTTGRPGRFSRASNRSFDRFCYFGCLKRFQRHLWY